MLKLHEAGGTGLVASPQIQKKYKWQTCYPQIAQIQLKPIAIYEYKYSRNTNRKDKHFAWILPNPT